VAFALISSRGYLNVLMGNGPLYIRIFVVEWNEKFFILYTKKSVKREVSVSIERIPYYFKPYKRLKECYESTGENN